MVSPGFTFGWLGLVATLTVGQILLCGGEGPNQDGNVAESIGGFVSGTYCEDLHFGVQLVLWAVTVIPGLIIIFSLVAPFLNNTITGTIVGMLGLATFAVGFL